MTTLHTAIATSAGEPSALERINAIAASMTAIDPNDPANFPPREVQVPRAGLRNTLGYGSLAVGGAGVAAAGVSIVRALASGGAARLSLPMMLGFGGAALLGATGFGLSRLIGPRSEHALAAGIPTRAQAELVDRKVSGYTKIVECADGTFAILRADPPSYSGGGSSGGSRSGGSRSGGSSRPSGPSYPSTGGGGSTSRGDDSGSSRNSTDNGNPSRDDF